MTARASVIATAAISPLGEGPAAVPDPTPGAPARVAIERNADMVALGFARPFAACVKPELASFPGTVDRAEAMLSRCLRELSDEIAPLLAGARVGFVVGTSSGGMRSAERLFEARSKGEPVTFELARAATYFAPFTVAERALASRVSTLASMQIVTACAASTWAIGVGLRWLARGKVDLVIAGGYDAHGPFVASGFECLRATSASLPAPFRVGRDGMALGEGAGFVALVREGEERGRPVRFLVSGFGASTDAVHITAPDRTGGGLARAGAAALADARLGADAVALVSAHATATPYNDAMESKALSTLFGDRAPIVHPFKAEIGHTLGAAGVLETLALAAAIERQVAPAAAGTGELDPEAPARLLSVATATPIDAGLKLSAAFGGANASLVVERAGHRASPDAKPRRPVFLMGFAHAASSDVARIAAVSGQEADKIARADAISLLLATAIAGLGRDDLAGAGIIVGHGLATIDINDRFYQRVLAKGPAAAEPRVFPPTSPNLMPGQVAIYFGLTGPSAALASGVGGALQPLDLAAELVAAGDADRMIAASVDVFGPASRDVLALAFPGVSRAEDGAVAALLGASPEGALAPVDLDRQGRGLTHESLLEALEALAGKR